MPYASTSDLPPAVKSALPKSAQEIFRAVFNSAVKTVSEERAFRVAWAAVKKKFKKNAAGAWVAKDEAEVADEETDFEEAVVFEDGAWQVTEDGYLVAEPRVARTGIQIYKGWEFGVADMDVVRVYRPEDTVFDKNSMKSYAHKPITLDHPRGEMVNSKNWREHAVGWAGGEVARDGEFLRVPLVVMDENTIRQIKKDHNQLSVGYFAHIDWAPGQTPDGQAYDAVQRGIRVNHIAIVAQARGGPKLRLGDEAIEDNPMTENIKTKTVTLDGIDVTMDETTASIVDREYRRLSDKLRDASAQIEVLKKVSETKDGEAAVLKKASETKDGEIIVLKKAVEDTRVTPEALDKRVADRLAIARKAAAVLGDKLVTDGKSDLDIMRAVVASKVGDTVMKTLSDDAVGGAFLSITADVKETADHQQHGGVKTLADSLRFHSDQNQATPGQQAWMDRGKIQADAWKEPGKLPAH